MIGARFVVLALKSLRGALLKAPPVGFLAYLCKNGILFGGGAVIVW